MNNKFYKLISSVLDEFMKNVNRVKMVFEDAIEGILFTRDSFIFPCKELKYEIIVYAIRYYINMRMYQWTNQTNQNIIKINTTRLSKFSSS